LLGFWDPAPGREKVLRVVYLWEGKEAVAEVKGREELRLP
jgi:DnaJ family protein C protein 11